MIYFNEFPKIDYNMTGINGNVKEVTDIWRRVKVRSKIASNVSLYDAIEVPEGDSPETIAYKVYGDTSYFWVVCLLNNVVNRYHDWPLDEFNFQQFVADSEKMKKAQKNSNMSFRFFTNFVFCFF